MLKRYGKTLKQIADIARVGSKRIKTQNVCVKNSENKRQKDFAIAGCIERYQNNGLQFLYMACCCCWYYIICLYKKQSFQILGVNHGDPD